MVAVKRSSLSARRAWIEIGGAGQLIKSSIVALRKESVDRNIRYLINTYHRILSLSARRAWIEIPVTAYCAYLPMVALRKESVDRNKMAEGGKL